MPVKKLTSDVYWLPHCRGENTHLHFGEYLIESEKGYILIDSGSGLHRDLIVEDVEQITDGDGVDAVILTHQSLPHSENVSHLESRWGDLEIVMAIPKVEGIDLINDIPEFKDAFSPGSRGSQHNQRQQIAGRTITCMRPFLTDITVSQWIFDHKAQILFTAEAFGHYHSPGECQNLSTEMGLVNQTGNIGDFYKDKFTFLDQLDLQKLREAFDLIHHRFDPEFIAPMHGNPVASEDIGAYLDTVIRSMKSARDSEDE